MEYIPCKTILQKNPSTNWFGNNYNINLYRGCCHGCIYCDSRSECYRVENFDTVRAKENCIGILREELRRKKKSGIIGTGAMSDPYNPFERQERLTEKALELIDEYQFGVTVITKSDLILRDIDLYRSIAEHHPVLCKMTVTTCDDMLCQQLEPHVTVSSKRLEALAKLSAAGLRTGITMMPILPYLEDSEKNILGIVEAARTCGVQYIYPYFGVTLRQNQREHYYQGLDRFFPGLRERYVHRYGERYSCDSPYASRLWQVFSEACDRCGILYHMQDIIRSYQQGYGTGQLSLFEES